MEISAARETHRVEGVARVAAALKQVIVEPNREVARAADTQTLRAAWHDAGSQALCHPLQDSGRSSASNGRLYTC